jgi:hypothetical protein
MWNPRRKNQDPGYGIINILDPQHCTKRGLHSCRGKFAERMIDALKGFSDSAKNGGHSAQKISNFQQKS